MVHNPYNLQQGAEWRTGHSADCWSFYFKGYYFFTQLEHHSCPTQLFSMAIYEATSESNYNLVKKPFSVQWVGNYIAAGNIDGSTVKCIYHSSFIITGNFSLPSSKDWRQTSFLHLFLLFLPLNKKKLLSLHWGFQKKKWLSQPNPISSAIE